MRDHPRLQGVWGGQQEREGEACQELSSESGEVWGAMKDTGHTWNPSGGGEGDEACRVVGKEGKEGFKEEGARELAQREARSSSTPDDLSFQVCAWSQPVSPSALRPLPLLTAPTSPFSPLLTAPTSPFLSLPRLTAPTSPLHVQGLNNLGPRCKRRNALTQKARVSERMEGPNSLQRGRGISARCRAQGGREW